jgi:polyvinyl alcohol dehydrogenase (cytochrome)
MVFRRFVPTLLLALLPASFLSASPLEREATAASHPGRALFAEHCASCHTGSVPKAPGLEMMGYMAPGALARVLDDGVMRPMSEHLSAAEKLQVIGFVTGKEPSGEQEEPPLLWCRQASVEAAQPYPNTIGWGVTPANTRAYTAELSALNRDNVGQLQLKWAFGFPDAVRARSQPLIAGGRVFVGSQDGTVYALDRDSGCVHWRFFARSEVRTGIIMASAEEDKALLLFGDYLGYVYAVNPGTGELRWDNKVDDHPAATITGTPALHGDSVYVPVTSLEVASAARGSYPCCTFRGSVVAYDWRTGQRRWKTYSIPELPQQVGENDLGVARFAPSGAGIWNSPTVDPERGVLYVGTGQNYSSPTSATSDAVLAIELDTGKLRWAFQTRRDAWNTACELADRTNCPEEAGDDSDMDIGAAVILSRGNDGKDYLLAGQKSGHVWALQPDDGGVVWQRKLGRGGMLGGVHFGMAATKGTVIVPINDEDVQLSATASGSRWNGEQRPGIYALEVASGQSLWAWPAEESCDGRPMCKPGHSAPATVTDELVVTGSLDGHIRIQDLRDGKVLWRHDTVRDYTTPGGATARGGAMAGGSGAVLQDGLLLMNSGYMLVHHMPGNVLLAFELAVDDE